MENFPGKGRLDLPRLLLITLYTAVISLAVQSSCFAVSVTLQWDPNTETDLAGYNVYYSSASSSPPFSGTGALEGASPLDARNQTAAVISGLDPGKTYYFAVTAYNKSGAESAYSNIVSVPESVPPAISLDSPANNSVVSGTVAVIASAADNLGVAKVEYYVNGSLQYTDTSDPYLFTWDTASLAVGSYTLTARAYDAAGNAGQSAPIAVTVVKDTTPPAVSLTGPANNTTVRGTITLTASADDNAGVSMLEVYDNNILIAAANLVPFNFNWNTTTVANGSHILTAKAYDTSGNIGYSGHLSLAVANSSADFLVKLNDNGHVSYHRTLSAAYSAIGNSANVTISAQAVTFEESLNFNRNIAVKVVGGYDASFTTSTGMTKLQGSLTFGPGVSSIERMTIH